MRVTERGTAGVLQSLKALAGSAPLAVEAGLFEHGSKVEGDAKELVPVDKGNLRASGFTLTPSLQNVGPGAQPSGEARAMAIATPQEISAVVGFGGPSLEYALIQHERTDFHHAVGQAKYLSQPAQQRAPELPATIAKHVQRAVERMRRGTA